MHAGINPIAHLFKQNCPLFMWWSMQQIHPRDLLHACMQKAKQIRRANN
jgi:hypothetical protein